MDVVELVKEHENKIDAVLCTGDISQDASLEAYQRFAAKLDELEAPQLWIPGNHDLLENMIKVLGSKHSALKKTLRLGNWGVVMLNSCLEGSIFGMLSPGEQAFLDKELIAFQAENRHIIIALHHNPVPVNAEWLQHHSLQNPADFFELVDGIKNLKCVIFGHIHQDFKVSRNNVLMLGAPSTSIQFHPEHNYFSLDKENPGYRWLNLHADGTMSTGVRRVIGKKYKLNLSSQSY